MLTFRAEVMRNERKKDETFNVKIRVTYQRRVKRLSTSIFVRDEDLTKSFKLKNPRVIKEVDVLIRSYQELCIKLQLELNNYTLDEIIRILKMERETPKKIDFLQFCKEWLDITDIKGKKNYKSALHAFMGYLGADHLNTDQVTSQLLNGFKSYLIVRRESRVLLLQKQGRRTPSNRMVSLYMGSIRHLFNEAKKQYNDYDRNIVLIPNSPFEYVEVPKQEVTRKRAVPTDIIKKIWKLPYKDMKKGYKATCRYNLAKDCFILSFCLMGMNSADLYNTTEMAGNTIIYNRTKTKDRRLDKAQMKVDIPKLVQPLIEKYRDKTGKRLFNFYQYYADEKSFNKAINYGLKEIGTLLEVDDLEYYAARHSWATIAINKVGIDKYTVHAALNHIDEAMKVTDIYIERDFVNENRANAKVVKYVFGK
ncbi:MAG: site-specific integrase [Bacteroides sp.]|nr:site-specific integrase [Bacteroides sp.]